MDKSDAGRLGGNITNCKYGINRFICPVDGRLCPRKLDEKSKFYSDNGRKGGQAGAKVTAKKYGKDYSNHMSEIGKKGGRGNKRRKSPGKPPIV